MQLNEKGYYFAVLVLGLFSAASYQKTEPIHRPLVLCHG
ncbi:YiaA/YiaB family inner membrane protein [Morganella morganii]|nr:hypothetical protein CP987_19240 [Morganella morganii]